MSRIHDGIRPRGASVMEQPHWRAVTHLQREAWTDVTLFWFLMGDTPMPP